MLNGTFRSTLLAQAVFLRCARRFTLRERRQHRICGVRLRLECVNTPALAFLAATALTPLEICGIARIFHAYSVVQMWQKANVASLKAFTESSFSGSFSSLVVWCFGRILRDARFYLFCPSRLYRL